VEPVRIRLYGLLSVTRRGYLTQLGLGAFLLFCLLVLWYYLPTLLPAPRGDKPEQVLPSVELVRKFRDALPWVVLGIAALFGIEAYVVLRRFAQKERLQQARQPESSSSP